MTTAGKIVAPDQISVLKLFILITFQIFSTNTIILTEVNRINSDIDCWTFS
jgi:hypothetical protein